MKISKLFVVPEILAITLAAAFVIAAPAPKVRKVDAGSYPDQRTGNPASVQQLSAALKNYPEFDVYKILWQVQSGIDLGRPDTQQIVYDRRARTLEYQGEPNHTDKWFGWTNVDEADIRAVAQEKGYLKNLENRGCKFIPYNGPIH